MQHCLSHVKKCVISNWLVTPKRFCTDIIEIWALWREKEIKFPADAIPKSSPNNESRFFFARPPTISLKIFLLARVICDTSKTLHKNQNIKFSKENDADFSALLCKVSKLFTYFNVANKLSYWLLYHSSCCGMLTWNLIFIL